MSVKVWVSNDQEQTYGLRAHVEEPGRPAYTEALTWQRQRVELEGAESMVLVDRKGLERGLIQSRNGQNDYCSWPDCKYFYDGYRSVPHGGTCPLREEP